MTDKIHLRGIMEINKLIFEWDSDFTKLTQAEREELKHIQNNDEYVNVNWNDIEEVEPDEWDLQMLTDIENDPECKEFD